MAATLTAAVVLLMAVGGAHLLNVKGDYCVIKAHGQTSQFSISVPPTSIPPRVYNKDVYISDPCPTGYVGMKTIVCDPDQLSTVKFCTPHLIHVHRDRPYNYATVTTTVYCKV